VRRLSRLPALLRLALRDVWETLTGRRNPLHPSHVRAFAVGQGDFAAVGEHLLELAVSLGGLQPTETILDAGCGVGRLAVPLTRYITSGSYIGFDVSRSAIRWCQRQIASRFPRFRFVFADVWNQHYNKRGAIAPNDFSFPASNGSVDLVFMSSVMTHLTPPVAARYVAETARVLKPGGRALLTFFLLDDDVRAKLREGLLAEKFVHNPEPWWAVKDPRDPEAAIAFELEVVAEALRARGLTIASVSRGRWSGNPDGITYQDVVVAIA
jgi:SAM-dependent methyltransferase